MMKIKLVSDLHLEFSDITINNDQNCDVLLLAGDIMVAHNLKTNGEKGQRFRDFLTRVSNDFPRVIYIAGNHEFYHGEFPGSILTLRETCENYPNIDFLEMDVVTIQDVTFLGTTLWTDMNKMDPHTIYTTQSMMNDFRLIRHNQYGYRKLRPEDTADHHHRAVNYIHSVVAEQHDRRFVVVGHHAPSALSVHQRHRHETIMNGAYMSELHDFIADRPQIKLWVHGHTHYPFDYKIGETRIVCNPRGYEGYEEPSGWDPNLVIEI